MKRLGKQSKFIEQGKVSPIHPDYPYSNVCLMLLVDKIGSSKTNDVLKHLLISDRLYPKGTSFYSKIVYSGRLCENDETYPILKRHLCNDCTSVSKSSYPILK
jgi:hypothetical protein